MARYLGLEETDWRTMKASNPNEIGAILDDKSGLREKVVRNLGDFTVALPAIYNSSSERLAVAGTGTLVVIDKSCKWN